MIGVLVHKDPTKIGGYEKLTNYLARALDAQVINITKEKYNPDDYNYLVAFDDFSAVCLPRDRKCTIYLTTPRRSLYDMYYTTPLYLRPIIGVYRAVDQYFFRHTQHNLIGISHTVRNRINKYYQREAGVIYPCIEVDKYRYEPSEDYWFIPQRIDAKWKRTQLIVDVFGALPYQEFMFSGDMTEEGMIEAYAKCKGVIAMGIDEDFGYTPIEAFASGKHVIAPAEGGYLETVKGYGTLINPTKEELVKTVKGYKEQIFMPEFRRAKAAQFDFSIFKEQWRNHIKINIERHE